MATTATKSLDFESIIDKEEHADGTVYIVVGSKGDLYRVTTVGSEATGCTCAARSFCYHMRGIESYLAFEAAWNAPIVNEMVTVDETPAPVVERSMTIAEFVLGKFGEDLEAHIEDEFSGEFAEQAALIIAREKRKARRGKGRNPNERIVEQGPSGDFVLMAS